ncbi:MAG: hypothetical protein GY726_07860, partial [Proteobacteria bacterium]|nr:hypothetical protein [Pseudomonadota bacterium]
PLWSEATTAAELGDEHYGHRRFKQAQSAYEAASQSLRSLQANRPQILSEVLISGQTLLQENQAGPAISAFERVLLMQVDHPEAQTGLAKARVRMQVLDLMKDGQQAEINTKPALAAETYTAALQLDSSYRAAQSALQAVNKILARQAYQDAMSRALSYLDSGELKAADKALGIAATIKPGTPELQDAKRRLQSLRQQSALNNLRRQARAQAELENWAGAAGLYEKALGIDAQATFASSGLQHAKTRLKLHNQLDHYLEAPERLSSDEPLKNANTLLQANPGKAADEPMLTAKLAALTEALRLATIPITLLIESDNQTEVAIYHVGRLGAFEQKQISLRPGRYTVTGTRVGFRDVRKVISLGPASPASVSIRCEERI